MFNNPFFFVTVFFALSLIWSYVRIRKIPKKLTLYRSTEIPVTGIDIRTLARFLAQTGRYIKLEIFEDRLVLQDPVTFFSWGNVYQIKIEKSGIVIYYHSSFGIKGGCATELRELSNLIRIFGEEISSS